jgi:hypothetical protein
MGLRYIKFLLAPCLFIEKTPKPQYLETKVFTELAVSVLRKSCYYSCYWVRAPAQERRYYLYTKKEGTSVPSRENAAS